MVCLAFACQPPCIAFCRGHAAYGSAVELANNGTDVEGRSIKLADNFAWIVFMNTAVLVVTLLLALCLSKFMLSVTWCDVLRIVSRTKALVPVLFSLLLATYFMTYHTVLKTSDDFVGALRYARDLGDNITRIIAEWNMNKTKEAAVESGSTGFTNLTEKVFPYRWVPTTKCQKGLLKSAL